MKENYNTFTEYNETEVNKYYGEKLVSILSKNYDDKSLESLLELPRKLIRIKSIFKEVGKKKLVLNLDKITYKEGNEEKSLLDCVKEHKTSVKIIRVLVKKGFTLDNALVNSIMNESINSKDSNFTEFLILNYPSALNEENDTKCIGLENEDS